MSFAVRRFILSGFMIWVVAAAAMGFYFYRYGKNALKFGIDLVGGTYITLEVQEDDVVKNELNDKVKPLSSALKSKKIDLVSQPIIDTDKIVFSFDTETIAREAYEVMRGEYKDLVYNTDGSKISVSIPEKRRAQLMKDAVRANIEILSKRLDGMSVAEIHISQQGDKQIVIELPDVHDVYHAKQMIGKSAVLEFKLVEDTAASREELMDKYDHELPEGTLLVSGKARGGDSKSFYLVPEYTSVSGKYFKDAKVSLGGEFGTDMAVSFEFDEEGGNRFHELTSSNIGKLLAIVLDDEVIQVAHIKSAIGKSGQITGTFSSEEASMLAKLLKSGAFKAKVNFIEERQIGPTLGQESITKGLLSCVIGLVLLLLFGMIFYKLSGFFAALALVYNLLLVLMFMSFLKATLTLPGIAGMILTIGMAIDASILIYEHIRDALKTGTSVSQSIQIGFKDALYVILDSNITTFIVALVLFYFGTGPIQGFAVTMMVGIVSTLITGLLFLKSLFAAYVSATNTSKLSI